MLQPNHKIVIGSLAYLFYDNRVLLLKRNNMPFKGYWSAPGGKMEFGESPHECCIREVREETGIDVSNHTLSLRAIQTVLDIAIPIHWQLFIYRINLSSIVDLNPHPDHLEGELRWFDVSEVPTIKRPHTDHQHWAQIVAETASPIWQAKFVYDTPDNLDSETVY